MDDGGIDDDDYGNDANVGDCLSKTDSDDDADSDGGNSNDDGDVDGNGVYNIKGGDEVNDGNAHTKSVAGDLAECNESSKMKMRVGIMWSPNMTYIHLSFGIASPNWFKGFKKKRDWRICKEVAVCKISASYFHVSKCFGTFERIECEDAARTSWPTLRYYKLHCTQEFT